MVNVLLKQQGYMVTESNDGQAALTILSANPDFDLIITNLQMPGMDGLHLMAQLRQYYPQIPLLIMSAFLEQTAVQVPDQYIGYLPKPFSRQQLLDAVNRFSLS